MALKLHAVTSVFVILGVFFSQNVFAEPRNFGQVTQNVFRGARLDKDRDYRELADDVGVTAIINLERFLNDSERSCRRHGLQCMEFPIFLPPLPHGDRRFDYGMLHKAFATVVALSEDVGQKVYFHCYHGSDRTGALAAAIQIRQTACNGAYDERLLRDLVSRSLDQYGFHSRLYPTLRRTILSWVVRPPDWICE